MLKRTKNPEIKLRCVKCGKLLAKKTTPGRFEVKCHRCGTLNSFFDKLAQQVMITDREGKILYINEATEYATGYSLDESVGNRISDLWGGEMPKYFYKKMWTIIRSKKEKYNVALTNKSKTGETYKVDLTIFPILDPSSEVIFYVGVEMNV